MPSPCIHDRHVRAHRPRRSNALLAMCAVVSLFGGLGIVAAQPLNPTMFFYASTPVLSAGERLDGHLTPQSRQNYKDGSYLDVVLFDAKVGERVRLQVVSMAFDAYLTIYEPDGTFLLSVDDGPMSLDPDVTLTPEKEGVYLLVVSGYGPRDVGAYQVIAERVTTRAPVVLSAPGRIDGFLEGSEAPDPEVNVGPSQAFLLELAEPSLVRLRASSANFDTVLTVFSQDGFVDENDDADGTNARLLLDLPPGRYRIVVSAFEGGSGPFELTAERYVPVE